MARCKTQPTHDLAEQRKQAVIFESCLPVDQRKRLGQYFSGLPLAKILAALCIRKECSSIIDPMAGHGDLLDAAMDAAYQRGLPQTTVDAIEIDPVTASVCQKRLKPWDNIFHNCVLTTWAKSAFDVTLLPELKSGGYDLVITNPPYVRYQTVSQNGQGPKSGGITSIREALLKAIERRIPEQERVIWTELTKGFSGLADLSVPTWIFAALLVRPGGILALVAPATWRTRDYADVLQYLLTRCFTVEAVVADRQPGWFSEALVRTNLVIARRSPLNETIFPLRSRPTSKERMSFAEIAPEAKEGESLVGAAFPGRTPEVQFASWLLSSHQNEADARRPGITKSNILIQNEISSVLLRGHGASWMRRLEPEPDALSFLSVSETSRSHLIPHNIRQLIPSDALPNLSHLEDIGIQVSQGLRTGCNVFFYVEHVRQIDDDWAEIRVNKVFGVRNLTVPGSMLRPVIRRQTDLCFLSQKVDPPGRVLDLRAYVLPEDYAHVEAVRPAYMISGQSVPTIMPDAMAAFVRKAAQTILNEDEQKTIPELSAVRTNVRTATTTKLPHFWYMLPDFARRHIPDAFVARINHDSPWIIANQAVPFIIDANFSTIRGVDDHWTANAIVGLLNSTWSRACMESIGTPMGGGALKLEATHLRRLPVPHLQSNAIHELTRLGSMLSVTPTDIAEIITRIDRIVVAAIFDKESKSRLDKLINILQKELASLHQTRQRG